LINTSEIGSEDLSRLLDSGEEFTIVDVREKFEVELGAIKNAVNFPLSDVAKSTSELEALITKNPGKFVIYCQAGIRSAKTIELLKLARPLLDLPEKFELINLTGGYLEWSSSFE